MYISQLYQGNLYDQQPLLIKWTTSCEVARGAFNSSYPNLSLSQMPKGSPPQPSYLFKCTMSREVYLEQ